MFFRRHARLELLAGGCALVAALDATVAAASSLSAQLGARVARPSVRSAGPPRRYRVEHYKPLISEPHANCHAVALRASDSSLEVIHRWDHRAEYDLSTVPWTDIVANKVQYSLSSMYGATRTPQSAADAATCDPALITPAANASPSALPPRCHPSSQGGTLGGYGRELTLFTANKSKAWIIELPTGHEVIDFVLHEGLILVATRSNQGARDGELLLPYLTTHVFAIAQPPSH